MAQKLKKRGLLLAMGLDTSIPAEYIHDSATPNCSNVSINKYIIEKRIGSTAMGDSLGERILAYEEFTKEGSTNLLRIGITSAESYNYGSDSWSAATGTPMTANSNYRISATCSLISGDHVLIFTNGINPIQKWTGVGTCGDLDGDPPLAKYVLDFQGYLLLANVISGGNPRESRVQWPDTGNVQMWAGGNSGLKDLLQENDAITGLAIYGNYATVHKESAIYIGYLVNTSSIFKFDRKNTGVGTVCNNTIQNLPTGEQAFLSKSGIHLFNGISAPLIPCKIMEELRQGLNPENVHKSWSVIVSEINEYWVAVPMGSQTEPDTIYKYNYYTQQCHRDARSNICAVGKYTLSEQKSWADQVGDWSSAIGAWDDVKNLALNPIICFGDTSGVSTKRDSVNDDNGTVISAYWDSKIHESDEKGRLARWLKMQVWAKGNNVKIEYSIDGGETWVLITTLALGSSFPTDDNPLYCYFDVVSTKIQFRFSNSTRGESFSLKQYIVEYQNREMR